MSKIFQYVQKYSKNSKKFQNIRLFVCLNGPQGYPWIMSVPGVGFSFKPKRLALVTSLFQDLPTYVEPGYREGQTNIPNS